MYESAALAVTRYEIVFKPTYAGKDTYLPEPLPITEDQYRAVGPLLNDYRFIEVAGETYATDRIDKIHRVVSEPSGHLLKIGDRIFYTQAEYEEYARGKL